MNDLLARIKAEGWFWALFGGPTSENILCMLDSRNGKSATGAGISPELAIVEAIREMDRR